MKKPASILLIDDDPINNFVSYAVLTRLKISDEVSIESNGKKSLAFLRSYYLVHRSLPEIIFLDITMPIMDGLEFLNQFNLEFAMLRSHVNIIVLSATWDEKLKFKAARLGVRHFIEKPLSTDVMIELFRNLYPGTTIGKYEGDETGRDSLSATLEL